MSDIVNDDDLSALAAEYVLGTLEADERTRANVLLDVDHGFRGLVRVWERRFGELHLMVEPVEPDGKTWQRIKNKLNTAEAPPAPAPAAMSAPAAGARKETAMSPPAAAARKETAMSLPAAAARKETASATVAPSAPVVPPEPAPETKPDPVATAEQKLAELINEVGRFEKKAAAPEPVAAGPAAAKPAAAEPAEAEPAAAEPAEALAVDIEDEPTATEHVDYEPPPPVLLPPTDRAPRAPRIVRQRPPQGGSWRAMALLMTVVAFGLGGLIAAWRYVPERLPQRLQPRVVLNLSGDPQDRAPAPHGTQFEE